MPGDVTFAQGDQTIMSAVDVSWIWFHGEPVTIKVSRSRNTAAAMAFCVTTAAGPAACFTQEPSSTV